MNDLSESLNILNGLNIEFARKAVVIAIIILVAAVIQRILKRMITRFCERAGLSKHVVGILTLIANIAVVASGIFAVLGILGLPLEAFTLTGALAGTAIGFASTQTVGNFLAGIYILVTMPFKVDDYVKIGNVEGEVEKITINYTMIFTPTYNIMEIPNKEILNSMILNCTVDDLVDYSFRISFDHSVRIGDLTEKCISKAIDEFYKKYGNVLPRKPECSLAEVGRLENAFAVRLFFPKGRAKMLYDLQPELTHMIVERWENVRVA